MRFSIVGHGGTDYKLSVALRDRVLRQPLGLQFTPQQLAAESTAIHIVGWIDDQIRACCVTVDRNDGWFQARQVAVDFDFQKQGYGQQLMQFTHQHIALLGADKIYCHSRIVAEAFYVRLGYQSVGDYFEEVSIQHIRMEKNLTGMN